MKLVTPNIAILIFLVILVISGILAWTMGGYDKYDKGALHTFISILVGLGIFVTFMFYYNLVKLQNDQQEFAAVQETSRISDNILNSVLKEIKAANPIIPSFVDSITPLTSKLCCETCIITEDPVNTETCTERMVLSYRLFSVWQDVISSSAYSNIDLPSYISNFLQRANSKQLHEQWLVNKLNFNNKTQQLGDILFTYALPITVQTPEEYINVTQKVLDDPNFKNIFD